MGILKYQTRKFYDQRNLYIMKKSVAELGNLLHRKTTPPLTEDELDSIKSFNDQISLQDVTDIYLPLAHLIQIYKRSKEDLAFSKGIFLQRESKNQPFIIGISGSVAVGKSTTSRLLQIFAFPYFSRS